MIVNIGWMLFRRKMFKIYNGLHVFGVRREPNSDTLYCKEIGEGSGVKK